ncbi:Bax inhibitor-1/YccA family protein [Adhaeretor mobilis]|uniref:Inhibitor of apoptosis-promoting Bax1 n=1 Tax=Adhaeretor mobilis TaxID=1930276 RepID=A0A517N1I9_9BACT|nr:Bax inhibitor-1 family protein [Adhaeretor mobilis]QDT01000.1 Inhibitor of apoptosis-promoting Bax1 [Adhaeretor mobilis]
MNASENPYAPSNFTMAAHAESSERATFITRTYMHLAGAILAFIGLEAVLLNSPIAERLTNTMMGGQYSWLIVLGAFMAVSWIANSWAMSSTSRGMQYAGLSLYVVAESIIILPLLYIAASNPRFAGVIPTASYTTLALFGVLTAIVFITRQDFSFMRSVLVFGGIAAMGLIVCAILFSFALGPIFTYAMIALACGYILYSTSNVMLHYRTDQYVAASLALFAAVALLFWYILQLFMSRD